MREAASVRPVVRAASEWWAPTQDIIMGAEMDRWFSAMREVEALGPVEDPPVPRSRWGWRPYAEMAHTHKVGPTVSPHLYSPAEIMEAWAALGPAARLDAGRYRPSTI
jgi:hypothetical protein